jgi:hypothetical protein
MLTYLDKMKNIKQETIKIWNDWALSQIDYTLGNNPLKFSYFNGYGDNYIKTIFPNCKLNTSRKYNEGKFGYTICNHTFDNSINFSSIEFIENLTEAIQNFIEPLHKSNYVLNNIELKNIKYSKKVYFNIEKMSESNKNEDKNKDIQNLISLIKDLYNKSNDLYDKEFQQIIISKINELTNTDLTNIIKTLKIIKIYLLYSFDLLDYRINRTKIIEDIDNIKINDDRILIRPTDSKFIHDKHLLLNYELNKLELERQKFSNKYNKELEKLENKR